MLGIDPQFIFFGLIVGILVGLTGIGGGSLMTPLLLLAGGIPPTIAIGKWNGPTGLVKLAFLDRFTTFENLARPDGPS